MLRTVFASSTGLARSLSLSPARVVNSVASFHGTAIDTPAPNTPMDAAVRGRRMRRSPRPSPSDGVIIYPEMHPEHPRNAIDDMLNGRFSVPFPTLPQHTYNIIRHIDNMVNRVYQGPESGTRRGVKIAAPIIRGSPAAQEVPFAMDAGGILAAADAFKKDTPRNDDVGPAWMVGSDAGSTTVNSVSADALLTELALMSLSGKNTSVVGDAIADIPDMHATSVIRKRRKKMKKHKHKKWLKKHRTELRQKKRG
eukprot:Opistho-2@96176